MLRDSWTQEQRVNIGPTRDCKRHAQSTMDAQNQPASKPFISHVISFNSVQQTITQICFCPALLGPIVISEDKL